MPIEEVPAVPEVTEIVSGNWKFTKFGEYNITARDRTFYNQLAEYAQANIEGMDRAYEVNLATIGAVSDVRGAKVSPFTEALARKYLEVGLFGEGGRETLQALAKTYGEKQVADAQELFHEIAHSVGVTEETAANRFSVEHTKKLLESTKPPIVPAVPEVAPTKAMKQAQEVGFTVVSDVQNLPIVKEGYTRLYHGTFSRNLQSIKEQGLISMSGDAPVLATTHPQLVEGGSVYGDVQVVFDVPTTTRVTRESGMGSGIVQFPRVSPEQIVGVFIEGKPPAVAHTLPNANSVRRTNPGLDAMVRHLGYEPVDDEGIARTDIDIVNESQERLKKVEVIPDRSLSPAARTSLSLAKRIADDVASRRKVRGVRAASIPPASDRVRTAGMYARGAEEIYISTDMLERGKTAVDSTLHEMAHHNSGAEDGNIAHSTELTRLGGLVVGRVAGKKYDDIIGRPEFRW